MNPDDPAETASFRVLRSRIDLSALPPLSRAVMERVILATADFDYVTDLVCDELALAAGVAALRRGVRVVADTPTVAAGVTGYPVNRFLSCRAVPRAWKTSLEDGAVLWGRSVARLRKFGNRKAPIGSRCAGVQLSGQLAREALSEFQILSLAPPEAS